MRFSTITTPSIYFGEDVFLAGLGDFFKKNGFKNVAFDDLVKHWEPYTKIDVKEYLGQWLDHNARVALSIGKVETNKINGGYISEVTINADADRDYEIFTSVGYQTEKEGEFHLVPVHLLKKGIVSHCSYRLTPSSVSPK